MELAPTAEAAGFQLLHVTRAESTNEAALKAVQHGADRFWVVADEQSAGRGRHGRSWASPPGNLYASLGLDAPCPPAFAPLIGFVAGLSLAEAILELAPALRPALALKWPNDCQIDGAKCAGILLEGASRPGNKVAIALGMGINVAHFPAGLDQRATCLAEHIRAVTPAALFHALSHRFAINLTLFDRGAGFAAIRAGWLAHAMRRGTTLRVRLPSGERHGAFAGIDEAGHLLLETGGRHETILVGDVFLAEHALSPEDAIRNLS